MLFSQDNNVELFDKLDTACINTSFRIVAKHQNIYPTSINIFNLNDSIGVEMLSDLLFDNFECLDSFNLFQNAECLLAEIAKLHEYRQDTKMLVTVLCVRSFYNVTKLHNLYKAKSISDKILPLYEVFRYKEEDLLDHLYTQQSVIFNMLNIKGAWKESNESQLMYASELSNQGNYKDALVIIKLCNFDSLSRQDKSIYLSVLIASNLFLRINDTFDDQRVLEYLKTSDKESQIVLFLYSLFKYFNKDYESLKYLIKFDEANCKFNANSVVDTSIQFNEEECKLYSILKGQMLWMLDDNILTKKILISAINKKSELNNYTNSLTFNAYITLGDIYFKLNNMDSAAYCLNRAKDIYYQDQTSANATNLDQIYYLSAKIDEYLGNIPSAILYYEKKVKNKIKFNINLLLSQDLVKLAELNIKILNIEEAINILNKNEILEQALPDEKLYYSRVMADVLFEYGNFEETDSMINKFLDRVDINSQQSNRILKEYYSNRLMQFKIAIIENKSDKADSIYDEIRAAINKYPGSSLVEDKYLFFIGLGYTIKRKLKKEKEANSLKLIFQELTNKNINIKYSDLYILVRLLGINSELFSTEFIDQKLSGYLSLYNEALISPYEIEYGNKLVYLILENKKVNTVSQGSRLSKYLLNYENSRVEKFRSNKILLHTTELIAQDSINEKSKHASLNNAYYNYLLSSYGDIEDGLKSKIGNNEALIRILTFDIDHYRHYLSVILSNNSDSLKLHFYNVLPEQTIINNFQNVLNTNDVKSHHILYDFLWKPLEYDLQDINRIIIIPNGIFSFVNINVIKDEEGQYLIDKYKYIQYLFTTRGLSQRNTPFINTKLVFIGNPRYSNDFAVKEFSGKKLIERGSNDIFNWVSLPNTGNEIDEISRLFNTQNQMVLIDTAANEQNFGQISCPRLLHIATHGFSNLEEGVASTGFVLSNANVKNTQSDNDGYIFSNEISEMNFTNTDLVTLSMCESGIGEEDLFSVVKSLSTSFLISGCNNVLYSVIKVDDNSTRYFMKTFYQYYASTLNPVVSISETMRELKEQYDLPKYWGGFVLMTTFK